MEQGLDLNQLLPSIVFIQMKPLKDITESPESRLSARLGGQKVTKDNAKFW